MRITLTRQEIMRAVQFYVAAKTGSADRDCDVRLYPCARRGLYATVDVLKPAPTLNDAVPHLGDAV